MADPQFITAAANELVFQICQEMVRSVFGMPVSEDLVNCDWPARRPHEVPGRELRASEQALKISDMLLTRMGYEQAYGLLYDFSQRCRQATHTLERVEMAAGAFSNLNR